MTLGYTLAYNESRKMLVLVAAASSSCPPPILSAKIHLSGYTYTHTQLHEARLLLRDAPATYVPWTKRPDLVISTHATFAFGLRWGLVLRAAPRTRRHATDAVGPLALQLAPCPLLPSLTPSLHSWT